MNNKTNEIEQIQQERFEEYISLTFNITGDQRDFVKINDIYSSYVNYNAYIESTFDVVKIDNWSKRQCIREFTKLLERQALLVRMVRGSDANKPDKQYLKVIGLKLNHFN